MNTLLQRTGPRLALIATEGFQDVLRISRGASWMDAAVLREIRNVARITKAEPLVEPEMMLAVRERVDCFGKVVRPLDEEHFLDGLRARSSIAARAASSSRCSSRTSTRSTSGEYANSSRRSFPRRTSARCRSCCPPR